MRELWIACVVAAAGALTGCQQKTSGYSMQQLLARVKGPDEQQLVRQMFESEDPDLRRLALEQLSVERKRRRDPYLKGYAALAQDPDPTVRSAAVRALGLGRDPRYADMLITGLKDRNRTVRWDAAVALDAVVSEEAVKPLAFAALNDEDADVRAAAAGGLRNYPRGDVVEALVRCLDDPEFAVRFKAAESLRELTGEDAGTDPSAWGQALSGKKDLFKASARPQKPWWDLLGATQPKPPPPSEPAAASAEPEQPEVALASVEDNAQRPWWDWLGATESEKPKGQEETALAAGPGKQERPQRDHSVIVTSRKPKLGAGTAAAEDKKPQRPWWDWLGVTKPQQPKGRSMTVLASEDKKLPKGRAVTDLAAEEKKPQRPWWDWLGVTKPQQPKGRSVTVLASDDKKLPKGRSVMDLAAEEKKSQRPWWDWLGVTKPQQPKGRSVTDLAADEKKQPRGRSVTDLAAEDKKSQRPWWDWLGITQPKKPKGQATKSPAGQ